MKGELAARPGKQSLPMTARSALTTARPEDLLAKGSEELGLALGPSTRQQFLYYAGELLRWNTRINLTGLKTPREVVVKHFLDSLAVWPWIKDLESLADIGTGAGFPGLPLKLALPHLRLTLIEPTAKKTAFLHFISAHLGLADVEIRQIHLTATAAQRWGPLFQGVITRATFPLAHYMEIGAPLVKPGGRLLAMKGPNLEEAQWQEAVSQAAHYQLQSPEKWEYSLPLTGERRLLVMWEKLGGPVIK
jgi:16S rRNA (guanine527-N7)-methyltransferase